MKYRIRTLAVPKTAAHGIVLAACLACALAPQAAAAGCPPGYRPKGPQCMPAPVKPHGPLTAHSNASLSVPEVHTGQKPGEVTKEVDRLKVKPQPGAPIEHRSSATQKHGIIFVGGEKPDVSPAILSGHAALNTQPIPPGHALLVSPHPRSPVEKAGH